MYHTCFEYAAFSPESFGKQQHIKAEQLVKKLTVSWFIWFTTWLQTLL